MNDKVETPEEQSQKKIEDEIISRYGSLSFNQIELYFMHFQKLYNEKLNIESLKVKKEILEVAKKLNLTLHIENGNDLTAKTEPSKNNTKPTKMEPKYRNPENDKQTWAGHGRKPDWLNEQINSGKELDDFLIEQSNK